MGKRKKKRQGSMQAGRTSSGAVPAGRGPSQKTSPQRTASQRVSLGAVSSAGTSSGAGEGRLWIILFLIIFINGFEAGGYQASLWNIGQTYDLSTLSMGLFASVELFATMLAPLLLGAWADRSNKVNCMRILLGLQFAAALTALATRSQPLFLGSVFFLGLTTSALQFISIAALADNYPVSGKRKIGYMTSMYAFGAFVSPLVVSFYLNLGFGWRTLFALLTSGSLAAFTGLFISKGEKKEGSAVRTSQSAQGGSFVLAGVLLLCVVMCIYVGFENGFAFFVDTLFTDVLKSATGKLALSLFWVVMIPSRVLVGRFSAKAYRILLISVIAIPFITVIISMLSSSLAVLVLCVFLGFFSGAIYPSVLTILLRFSGTRTATATGMITTATGIGGFAFTALTGFVGDRWGMRTAMLALAGCFVFSLASVLALARIRTGKKAG